MDPKAVNAKILIFSADFKPMDGGLADYAWNLTKHYSTFKSVDVITFAKPVEFYPFRVRESIISGFQRKLGDRFLDSIYIFRKTNTFIHYAILFLLALIELVPHRLKTNRLICVSCYGYKQLLWINACIFLGFKYELVLHGLDILSNKSSPKLFLRVLHGCSRIIANSNATKALLLKFHPTLLKPIIIQYPVLDIGYINSIPLLNRSELENIWQVQLENKILISSVSRLVKRKGLDISITSISSLIRRGIPLVYIIAGKGEEFEKLNSLIISERMEKFIKLTGFISEAEKFSLLAESIIFVMPTLSLEGDDFEGFGISYIEASYMKNAVIGGIYGGVPEAIIDGSTGYILDFDLPDASIRLSDKIYQMITKNEIQKLAETGHEFVSHKHTFKNITLS